MSVTVQAFNAPLGLDGTDKRRVVEGVVTFSGNYTGNGIGDLPVWNPLTTVAGENLLLDAITVGPTLSLTTFDVTSNVANIGVLSTTFLATNVELLVNQSLTFSSVTGNASVLNGKVLSAASVGPTWFTANIVTPNTSGSNATTGFGALVIGPDDLSVYSVAGSGHTYYYNKSLATIQAFNGNVEVAAGNIATTLAEDTINFTAKYLKY